MSFNFSLFFGTHEMTSNASVLFPTVVNPDRESGRITLITRYGAPKVSGPTSPNCYLPFASFHVFGAAIARLLSTWGENACHAWDRYHPPYHGFIAVG